MTTATAPTTCTVGPSAVTGKRCGKPAVTTFTARGREYAECAEHAVAGPGHAGHRLLTTTHYTATDPYTGTVYTRTSMATYTHATLHHGEAKFHATYEAAKRAGGIIVLAVAAG